MKKDIQQKRKCIGNIKGNQASFILNELLGHCSAVDKDQIDILERLRLTASSGDDIVIDLRENNGKKTAHDDFWEVSVVYLYFFSSLSLLFQNHYIQLWKCYLNFYSLKCFISHLYIAFSFVGTKIFLFF